MHPFSLLRTTAALRGEMTVSLREDPPRATAADRARTETRQGGQALATSTGCRPPSRDALAAARHHPHQTRTQQTLTPPPTTRAQLLSAQHLVGARGECAPAAGHPPLRAAGWYYCSSQLATLALTPPGRGMGNSRLKRAAHAVQLTFPCIDFVVGSRDPSDATHTHTRNVRHTDDKHATLGTDAPHSAQMRHTGLKNSPTSHARPQNQEGEGFLVAWPGVESQGEEIEECGRYVRTQEDGNGYQNKDDEEGGNANGAGAAAQQLSVVNVLTPRSTLGW
ncbi:hypothetical protein GGX14DRAFT_672278 [Mycena pura]|uniref:Uncharacterized protein n=1 Tax=Mycena pura TaxID=153505 RepID=A0AAD6Y4U1_9AGAR|nr:hypothetical protein GGX14DRAFT_672278 [Mycena pura]